MSTERSEVDIIFDMIYIYIYIYSIREVYVRPPRDQKSRDPDNVN